MKTLISLLLCSLASVYAAGTVTQSNQILGTTSNYALTFYWKGDSITGSVPITTAILPGAGQGLRILQVETVPGTPAPTSGYNVALSDSSGGDIMSGAMVNLSSSAAQFFGATAGTPPIFGTFSLKITGQNVASAAGTVIVFFGPSTLINASVGSAGPQGPAGPPGPTGSPGGGALASSYDFAAQQPGTSLAIGNTAITMTPVPFGVNGTDVGHSLYVSGGTGTAEACLITGGTGTSGQTSGQIIINCANTHTGAWSIQSGSGGIQEAWNVAAGGIVLVSPGISRVYGEITLNGPGAINCPAASFPSLGSILQSQTATQNIIVTNSVYPVVINNCNFDAATTKTAGAAIKLACGATCTPTPNFRVWAGTIISECVFNHQFNGIDVEAAYGYVIRNNVITGTVATGTDLILKNIYDPVNANGDGLVDGNFIDSSSAVNIVAEAGGIKIANNKILHGNYGILVQPPDAAIMQDLLISGNSIEAQTTAGIFMRRKGPSNTGYWGEIQVNNNQITGVHASDTCILTQSAGADNKSVQYLDIRDNNISFCDIGISVATNLVQIQNNTLQPQVKGIVTTGATNSVAQNNTMLSFGTAANNYTLSADTLLTDSSTGILFANLPAVKNGSLVFCADCKNVTDNTTGTFDSAVAAAGNGTNALRENGAWRVH